MYDYTKVPADQYYATKRKREEMYKDMPSFLRPSTNDLVPVDLNKAFVPLKKDAPDNLKKTAECNLERFGLTEGGI